MQRLGCAAQQQGRKALGVYLVEPAHFDEHKKSTDSDSTTQTSRKRKQKGMQEVPRKKPEGLVSTCLPSKQSGEDETDSDSDANDDKNPGSNEHSCEDGSLDRVNVGVANANESVEHQGSVQTVVNHLPATVTRPNPSCFPSLKLETTEYKISIMDLFINAKSQHFYCCVVSNRYFGNHLVGEWGILSQEQWTHLRLVRDVQGRRVWVQEVREMRNNRDKHP
jgi:hypothetical protein